MSLKLKLKLLSRKMKIIGKMHADYKGLGMHSAMSDAIVKCVLLYYIKWLNTKKEEFNFKAEDININIINNTKMVKKKK